MSGDTSVPRRFLTNLTAMATMLAFVALGLALLGLSAYFEHHETIDAVFVATIREAGALMLVTATLTVLWDLRGRRALAGEVLDAAGLSHEVQAAGLQRITDDYLSIDYNTLFASAQKVDLFFAYAHTWRATHATALRTFVGRDCAHLRVILPDPEDTEVVAQLAQRFGYEPQHMKSQIVMAAADMHGLAKQKDPKAIVEVRFTKRDPVFTSYRFDGTCVAVMYAQVHGREPRVPAIAASGGTLFRFFDDQFGALWNVSAPSDPSAILSP